jgi:hypothetical protein
MFSAGTMEFYETNPNEPNENARKTLAVHGKRGFFAKVSDHG